MASSSEEQLQYTELEEGLGISFKRKMGVTLSDVGIVSTSLHRMLNKTAERLAGIPRYALVDPESDFPGRFFPPRFYEPILIQASLTALSYESFSAETRLKIQRFTRDYSINIVAGLTLVLITNCQQARHQGATTESKNIPEVPTKNVDIGPNLASMIKRLSRSGGDWELHLKDTKAGAEIWIRHDGR